MKKVYIGLSGGLGPLMRTLPIAEALQRAGHEVAFTIFWESSARFLKQEGFVHITDWDDVEAPEPGTTFDANPVFYDMDHYHARFGFFGESFVRSLFRSRAELLKRYQPDLVISDLSVQTVMAARYLNIPVVTINQSCFHPDGKRAMWWQEPPRHAPHVTPVVNRVLEEFGMEPIARMEELCCGDLDLFPSLPAFDPLITQERTRRALYIGPIEYEAKRQSMPNDLPDSYVLVYPGRLHDGAGVSGLKLVRYVLQAFSDVKDREVLIASTEVVPQEFRESTASHIRFIDWFDSEMLEKACLFIHHGGHGSCMSALKHGVPSLVIPTITEREFNARQVADLQIGDYLLPECTSAMQLHQVAESLINDAEVANSLQTLRLQLPKTNEEAVEQVIDALSEFLQTPSRT